MNLIVIFRKLQPFLKATDWAVAVVSLGYGAYRQNYWWIAAGIALLLLAWLDPGSRITRYFSMVKPSPYEKGPYEKGPCEKGPRAKHPNAKGPPKK